MSRLLKVLFACLLIVLLAAVVGCGGETDAGQTPTPEAIATSPPADQTDEEWNSLIDEWNELVDQAWVLYDENVALETKMDGMRDRLDAVDVAGGNAADALPILADAKADLDKMKKNSESIIVLWDMAAELDISEEYNTYAGQQKEIEELAIKVYALKAEEAAKVADVMKRIYTLTPAEIEKVDGEVSDLEAKIAKLEARIGEMGQASDKYFDDYIAVE